jgi:hypothetical protein
VKNSIDVAEWHEKSFWSLYKNYLGRLDNWSSKSETTIGNLAKVVPSTEENMADETAKKFFADRYDGHAIRLKAYQDIGSALNGVVALQFLQTEMLIDMMENSRIYDMTDLKSIRYSPHTRNFIRQPMRKKEAISSALKLKGGEQEKKFWEVYYKYEEDCNALLGEGYNIYELYAGEAADFTPALAKRLGYEFLNLMEREIKLKEKYHSMMSEEVGANLAARFIAWEEYYSIFSKMSILAEAQ